MRGLTWLRAPLLMLLSCTPAAFAEDTATRVRVVDAAGRPVAAAVVWYGSGYPQVKDSEPAVVSQIDKEFVPEVTVIPTGASVVFPNEDSVSHHVYSFAQPNAFEFPLYKSGERPVFRFEHAGVVALGCNIHDSMLGYIVVVDSPFYAQADADGYASFSAAPPAGATAYVWSPRLDPLQAVIASQTGSGPEVTLTVAERLSIEARPGGGSLTWEDY